MTRCSACIKYCLFIVFTGLATSCLTGCGSESRSASSYVSDKTATYSPPSPANEFGFTTGDLAEAEASGGLIDSKPPQKTYPDASASIPKNNRKIIYESELRINVENFDGIDAKLNQLINTSGGFVSNAKIDSKQGRQRYGHWQIRIPVSKYQSFMSSVGDIGSVVSRKEDAKDVTAEFYDLEARIKNKQRLEERIAGLLDQAKGELKRLIEVEKELARVREEIERMEGRKRFLTDVTSLTTVDVYITEVENYVPEQAASFSDRVNNAWTSAVTQSTEALQSFIVGLVRNAINIAICLVAMLFLWIVYRVYFRSNQNPDSSSSQASQQAE